MLKFEIIYCILFIYITAGLSLNSEHNTSVHVDISIIQDSEACTCLPFYLCNDNNTVITTGEGIIDVRMPRCKDYNVCCKIPKEPSNVTPTDKTGHGQCGIRNSNGISNTNPSTGVIGNSATKGGSSSFGEFPWMAAVLKTDSKTYEDVFLCGGSVIHQSVILTAAHCLEDINTTDLKIRAGEWDSQTISESLPHQDRYVSKAVIHPQYHKEQLHNDIALLFLTSNLLFIDNVGTICLPEEGLYVNPSDCIATGWGKNNNNHTGLYQTKLKKIEMPLVLNSECQESLRTTQLGRQFILDPSFICAGGIGDQDTCQGDGGGPLVCKITGSTSSYAQVGVTSWGVGCGTSTPGVYASVSRTQPWIKTQLESLQV